jgi:LEA14-like dessication related protein
MKQIITLCLVVFTFCGCTETYKEVEFREIRNVQLSNVSGATVDLTGDCLLYNPNDVALDITDATFDVYVDGRKTAVVHQEIDVVMQANEQFILPLKATIDAKDFYGEQGEGLFRAAVQMIAQQKVTIKYDGIIKAGKGWVRLPVKVIDSVEVPVKLY